MNAANPSPQTIAKQIAQEPWEILREAGNQITGVEQGQQQAVPAQQEASDNSKRVERDKIRSQRLMQALQTELDEIEKEKEQEKLPAKEEEKKITPPLVEPATKKGRRLFNFGKKTQMQRQQTQTERPLPPSG